MMIRHAQRILEEISKVFEISGLEDVNELIQAIINAKKIVCCGAGRVGYSTKAFAMRLKHLGKDAYMIGDSNVPSTGEGDLILVSSGSGETKTIYNIMQIAKENGLKCALVTGNKGSSMGKIANIIVELKAPSKTKEIKGFKSIQPMTSLNEQSLLIFYDSLVLCLMDKMNETHDTMWARHSNLE